MSFAHPWLLLLVPLFALPLAVWSLWRDHADRPAMPFPGVPPPGGDSPPPPVSPRVQLAPLPRALLALALALALVALARPRVAVGELPVTREGVDIALVFDISTSMRAADFQPSDRFTVARETIRQFVDGRPADRMALVIFAGEAFTQVPLTLDRTLFKEVLDTLRMGVIVDGTAIGNALATGINRLRDSPARSRVLVLLTDGDNNAGTIAPEDAAQMAAEQGIRIHTVQVGRGGMVPYPVSEGIFGTVFQQVEVAVNPALLRRIAETTGGRFFVADDADALRRIFTLIDEMEKTEIEDADRTLYDEAFPWFLLPALALAALGLTLERTWLSRVP